MTAPLQHRDAVRVFTPGAPTPHPVTGNPVPGKAAEVRALVTLTPTNSYDLPGAPNGSAATDWQLLGPPGLAIGSASWVIDAAGRRFDVIGTPAELASLASGLASHVEARLRFVSDTQEA